MSCDILRRIAAVLLHVLFLAYDQDMRVCFLTPTRMVVPLPTAVRFPILHRHRRAIALPHCCHRRRHRRPYPVLHRLLADSSRHRRLARRLCRAAEVLMATAPRQSTLLCHATRRASTGTWRHRTRHRCVVGGRAGAALGLRRVHAASARPRPGCLLDTIQSVYHVSHAGVVSV